MADQQPGSGYWQTGAEIGRGKRTKVDPRRLQRAFERVGKALYKNVYDYSAVEFRGWEMPVVITIRKSGERLTMTPLAHIESEDGRGDRI